MANPDWLAQHGGEARTSTDGRSMTVYLGGAPQYLLMLAPTVGRFGCKVVQSNNGQRLDSGARFRRRTRRFRAGWKICGRRWGGNAEVRMQNAE